MALSRRGKRKIMVDGVEYLWWGNEDWSSYEAGAVVHIATPDRAFEVRILTQVNGRRAQVQVLGSVFGRGPVERGAMLRCEVTPADVFLMPRDVRAFIDWCQTPGPLNPYISPPYMPPDSPQSAAREAIWPLVRALRRSSLAWSAAVCDEEEQPVYGSPLLLHAGTHQLELWALGDQLGASMSACALEQAPNTCAAGLPDGAVWLMDPAPLVAVRGQYIVVASMYLDDAEQSCRVVSLMAGGTSRAVYIAAEQGRLVISDVLPAYAASLHYRPDLI
jgi:hypothetical protein